MNSSQVQANRRYREKNRSMVNEKERKRYAKIREKQPDMYEKKLLQARAKAKMQNEYRKAVRQLLRIAI